MPLGIVLFHCRLQLHGYIGTEVIYVVLPYFIEEVDILISQLGESVLMLKCFDWCLLFDVVIPLIHWGAMVSRIFHYGVRALQYDMFLRFWKHHTVGIWPLPVALHH
jgi:hypothetical protein